jgi:mannitol-1-phosphate 5-dehydrogenase
MKAVHFGAGNIGRGFLGQLYSESGYDTTFVEAVPSVVDALNRLGRYLIHIAEETPSSICVERVAAILATDRESVAEAIGDADIASTAVGVHVLPKIAETLAHGIAKRFERDRGPLDIIVCENLIHAGSFLREQVRACLPDTWHKALDEQIGFVEASIGRMVPTVPPEKRAEDPLWVAVEAYCELPVDADAFRGVIPPICHLKAIQPFEAYVERKLFIHNLGHATAAYLGYLAGHEFVWQAMEDQNIRPIVGATMIDSALALSRRHSLDWDDLSAHVADLDRRFLNRALGDQILRVAADPLRKLGPNDRFMGAIRMCLATDVDPTILTIGAAAALKFDPPTDPAAVQLQQMISEQGVESVVHSLAGSDEVAGAVLKTVRG